jgi:hypothetical protein
MGGSTEPKQCPHHRIMNDIPQATGLEYAHDNFVWKIAEIRMEVFHHVDINVPKLEVYAPSTKYSGGLFCERWSSRVYMSDLMRTATPNAMSRPRKTRTWSMNACSACKSGDRTSADEALNYPKLRGGMCTSSAYTHTGWGVTRINGRANKNSHCYPPSSQAQIPGYLRTMHGCSSNWS